ncbi:signal peptidase I [Coraliomargarita algicola]|uniref:Signal peptidase I n=1 Tax=Coraliomargarita algicola TaxID=3092156 RepID=A0ABZ0RR05_9BACT|nr:signal peptidase I [Coraliomargarita sp. J2-16]WPJ97220.1 signal peptidase I [Coraliomargarita sp. J2-16]
MELDCRLQCRMRATSRHSSNWQILMNNYLILLCSLLLFGCSESRVYENIGSTMSPTIQDGDKLSVVPIDGRCSEIERYDLILFFDPTTDEERYFVMRVWGLPGEKVEVENKEILIDGVKLDSSEIVSLDSVADYGTFKSVKLDDESFFVMGDNLENSWDSRFWGALSCENIVGYASVVAEGN